MPSELSRYNDVITLDFCIDVEDRYDVRTYVNHKKFTIYKKWPYPGTIEFSLYENTRLAHTWFDPIIYRLIPDNLIYQRVFHYGLVRRVSQLNRWVCGNDKRYADGTPDHSEEGLEFSIPKAMMIHEIVRGVAEDEHTL